MSTQRPTVHGYEKSSATARVRIALDYKGVDYDWRAVDFPGGEHRGAQYRGQLNPLGQVPSFALGDLVLTQSVAILEYIEQVYPEPALLPAAPDARARCRELVEVINAGVQPLQNRGVLEKLVADYDDALLKALFGGDIPATTPTEGGPWLSHWLGKGMGAFETLVEKSAGTYCVGDRVSLADVVLLPEVNFMRAHNLDHTVFPTIARIYRALLELTAFRAVTPAG